MKIKLIILIVLSILMLSGCINNNNKNDEKNIEILFNVGVTISEAEVMLSKYNVTIISIEEEEHIFSDGKRNMVTVYADFNDSQEIEQIISDISSEEIVWRCIVIYNEG